MKEYACSGIVARFPKSWRTDVIVKTSPGRDGRGNPLPVVDSLLKGALIGGRSSSEQVDRSDVSDSAVVLYHDTALVISNKDRVVIPEGSRMAGTWEVFGRPVEWPLGTEVVLKAG